MPAFPIRLTNKFGLPADIAERVAKLPPPNPYFKVRKVDAEELGRRAGL